MIPEQEKQALEVLRQIHPSIHSPEMRLNDAAVEILLQDTTPERKRALLDAYITTFMARMALTSF